MIIIDPQTRQRILKSKHSGDIVYDLSGDESIVTEDVPLIGNWSDYTGTGSIATQSQMMWASKENQLQGTDADIDGNAKLPNLNVRGIRKGTHRQRVIKRYNGTTDNC